MTDVAANHYAMINKLSAVADSPVTAETHTEQGAPSTPYVDFVMLFAPYVIAVVLFITALVVMTAGKLRSAKINAGMLVLALFAAAIPMVLSSMSRGVGNVMQASPGEEPINVRIDHSDSDSVLVHWETAKPQSGFVRYGTALVDSDQMRVVGNVREKSTIHEVILHSLESGATYKLEIVSGSTWYGTDGKPITFTFSRNGP